MEVGLRVPLDAEVSRPGSAVLPARLLLDVARSLPSDSLTMELRPAEQDIELICGPTTFHLRTLRAEDFPTLPTPAPDSRITLPADAFVETIARVARSASRDETRPVLTGHPHVSLRSGAEDGRHRLLPAERQGDRAGAAPPGKPRGQRAQPERCRSWPASPGRRPAETIAVSVGQNQAVFELGDVVLSSRLIDGQFPNYRQLLPESVEHELRLSSPELTDVVRRISLLAQKNAPLRLSFSEGSLAISAQTPDVGEARETIPVPYHGELLEIGFNPEFLRDGLESVDSSSCS